MPGSRNRRRQLQPGDQVLVPVAGRLRRAALLGFVETRTGREADIQLEDGTQTRVQAVALQRTPQRRDRWWWPESHGMRVAVITLLFTAIGATATVFAVLSTSGTGGSTTKAQADPTSAVRAVVADFATIDNVLPPDNLLGDCMKSRHGLSATDALTYCDSKSRRDGTSAITIIDRDIAALSLYSGSSINSIKSGLASIRNLADEMYNNYYIRIGWADEHCPRTISFLDASKVSAAELPRDRSGHVHCALAVQSDRAFLARVQHSDDPISTILRSRVPTAQINVFLVPGGRAVLTAYLFELDKALYREMLRDMQVLLPTLRAVIGG